MYDCRTGINGRIATIMTINIMMMLLPVITLGIVIKKPLINIMVDIDVDVDIDVKINLEK